MRSILILSLTLAVAELGTESARADVNLTPNPGVETLGVYVRTVNISRKSCAYQNGEISLGKHKILLFAAGVYNVGPDNLDLAALNLTPELAADDFVYDNCLGQDVLKGFLRFELWTWPTDSSPGTFVTANEIGLCLDDFSVIPGWTDPPPSNGYDCAAGQQGITAGWRAFRMYDNKSGPWIVIDDVPPGRYVLWQTVNAQHVIPESDATDNAYSFEVWIK